MRGKLARWAATWAAAEKSAAPAMLESLENRVLLSSYFLSPSGNDSAAGTIDAPWQTLRKAVQSVSAGDTINLRAGNYRGGVAITTPNVTLQAYNSEKASISAPTNDSSVNIALDIDLDATGVTLRNLDISGGYYYAVKTESNWDSSDPRYYGASNITIDNCKLHDSGADVLKITPGGDNITIRNSEIYNSGQRDPSNAEGIDAVNGDNLLIQDNYIHDIATNGIYSKGGAIGTVIERNRLDNIGFSGIVLGQDTDYEWFDRSVNPNLYESIDGVVRNNIVTNTQGAGVAAWAALRPKIYNNTLVNVAQSMFGGILIVGQVHYLPNGSEPNRPSTDVTVINNIVSVSGSRPVVQIRAGGLSGSLTTNHNSYFRTNGPATFWDDDNDFYGLLADWKNARGDAGSVEGSPKLDANFKPLSGSPVIDAGLTVNSVTSDYIRNARPSGAAYDIGAFESGGSATPNPGGGDVDPPIPPPPPPPVDAPKPVIGSGTGLLGQYFNNANLTKLKVSRVDPTVNFNWGTAAAPDASIARNSYSARWSGQVQAEYGETYTFYTQSDDGVRLWVNGQLLIDNWTNHGVTENSGQITLQAGQKYDIKMEYYQDINQATAKLLWSSASQAKDFVAQSQLYSGSASPASVPPSGNGLRGEYFLSDDFSGASVVKTDATVNFNWGTGSPVGSVPADHFSVQWTGTVMPRYSESYTFSTTADDGIRVWVNGKLLIDNWSHKGVSTASGKISLQAGKKYSIVVMYYEDQNSASAKLMWASGSQAKEVIPESRLFS